ncbi:hypothetical protein MHYP_G00014430 [Metynnis hypsauchen]
MAARCAGMMRVRTLCKLLTRTVETRVRIGSSWSWTARYRTRAEERGGAERDTERGQSDVLMEFPQAKSLLHSTLSRSLGRSDVSQYIRYHCTDGEVKRATVTLLWPQRIEVEGFGSRKVEAERRAAAAACHRLRELGVLGPGNQLPRRRLARRPVQSSFLEDADEDVHDRLEPSGTLKTRTQGTAESPRLVDQDPKVSEALAIFSKPKVLLVKVFQVATSSTRIRELLQYRTVGGKVKKCQLTLHWPEKMTFTGLGRRRLEAETQAAALACLRLKELNLLDEQNNPLTHAKYHQEEVREAGERERRPCRLEIQTDLEQRIRDYLTQYPLEAEMQKLWDEEEEQAEFQQSSSVAENDEEDVDDDDDPIPDPITGRPYRALSSEEAEILSSNLQKQWDRAGPARGAELPVDSHRERLVEAVEASRVLVVAGETGCGKTTRIPRFLLEGRVRDGAGAHCNILVTQPRRISAVSVAQRVSQEMGPVLRHCVGYQVRLESRPPECSGGALLFLTVGVLLRKLQSNPSLQGVSHVLVDEVHERDVNTDLLLALLRSALRENPELRVVLMSATGDTHRLARYFGGCPVEHVPGFMYPVKERYLEDVMKEMRRQPKLVTRQERDTQKGQDDASPDLDLVADVIDHIHLRGEPVGLTQQFSENLAEAELAARSVDCLRPSSRLNRHSHQEQLLKAVLLAGFYPNLIQVKRGTVTKGGRFRPDNLSYRTQSGPVLLHRSSVNRGERQLPSRWLTFFSAVKSNDNVFIRDSSVVHPLSLLLLTDCDLVERAYGDQVEVAMPGRSLVRWEMSARSWELLWELRTSLQAMVHRNLQALTSDSVSEASSTQDDQLISLLVELLNNTEPDANSEDYSDGE